MRRYANGRPTDPAPATAAATCGAQLQHTSLTAYWPELPPTAAGHCEWCHQEAAAIPFTAACHFAALPLDVAAAVAVATACCTCFNALRFIDCALYLYL